MIVDKQPGSTKSPNLADQVVMMFTPLTKPKVFIG